MSSVTRDEFIDLSECHCGKPLFKITDTSKSISYARCNYTKEEYDIKKGEWVVSKKQPCNFLKICYGERPIFKEIQQIIKIESKWKFSLEKELKTLFSFLMVSNRTSTLDEINLIVKNKLKKEPLKKFYFEDNRFSHYESYTDYRDRILSEKIVDLSFTDKPKPPPEGRVYAGHDYLKSITHWNNNKKVTVKKKKIKSKPKPQFIYDELVTDSDLDSENESESSDDENSVSEYETGSETESDSESVLEEEVDEPEPEYEDYPEYDDYDSGGDCYD
jgi:hypothetical protein